MSTCRGLALAAGLWAAVGPDAAAQFVSGEWVERSDAAAREHRMAEVGAVVFDAEGRLVPGAEVRFEQVRHAFGVGFVVPEPGFPVGYDREAEGWRVFNTASVERFTGWRRIQPEAEGGLVMGELDELLRKVGAAGLRVRWGPVVSGEAFDLPEWVVPLRGAALRDAGKGFLEAVLTRYGGAIEGLELAEETVGYERWTPAALRQLVMASEFRSPGLTPRLRFDDALAGGGTFEAARAIDAAVKQRMGFRGFSVTHRFGPRPIAQDRLEPALRRLTGFGRPIVVASLEVGGGSALEAATNAEVVLRTLFADPRVEGVVFAGLTAADLAEPSAALFDQAGEPTGVMRSADRLFREVWWSDETVETDELGRASARVFRGEYRLTATLPDGSRTEARLRVDGPRDVVLMPVAP
ncbi:MAG: hypothetical protein AAFX76_07585 [Planctomycetota bacterium]